eukprot:Unigene4947_Nuclearia_a/m.15142 Unigene4947_Nuclearia_a/g.15142  ORF Unigene4947_Nuclearia_a/g.15142 Unigene4947_Nuclearia_a/m.15142 type:complete len:363 (-) Unigene4947_Nuclearia_a:569-1657(-)
MLVDRDVHALARRGRVAVQSRAGCADDRLVWQIDRERAALDVRLADLYVDGEAGGRQHVHGVVDEELFRAVECRDRQFVVGRRQTRSRQRHVRAGERDVLRARARVTLHGDPERAVEAVGRADVRGPGHLRRQVADGRRGRDGARCHQPQWAHEDRHDRQQRHKDGHGRARRQARRECRARLGRARAHRGRADLGQLPPAVLDALAGRERMHGLQARRHEQLAHEAHVRVLPVLDLARAPGVHAAGLLRRRAHDREGEMARVLAKLVRRAQAQVIHGDAALLERAQHDLAELAQLADGHRVGLGDDGHDDNVLGQALHEDQVVLLEAMGRDEVEAQVDARLPGHALAEDVAQEALRRLVAEV